MKTSKLILVMTTLLFGYQLHAGGNVGNGGDVLLCTKANGLIQSIELLDFYEAKTLRKIEIDLGSENLSPIEKVRLALKRIEKLSPRRYSIYLGWAESFFSESNFVSNANLVDIPDSEIPVLPTGCRLEQIAIQKAPTFPQDKRFLVNSDLWDLLDNNNKAGLILHEIIYREGIELGQTNSRGARYFNSVISSKAAEQMTMGQFMQLISSVGFNSVEVGNLELSDIELYPNGNISNATVIKGSLLINGQEVEIEKLISYYPNGSVESTVLKKDIDLKINGQDLTFQAGWFEFHENGNLKKADHSCAKGAKKIYKGSNYDLKITNFCISFERSEFHSNGNPKSFERVEGELKTKYGQLKIKGNARFDEDGNMIEAYNATGGQNEYRIGETIYDFSGASGFIYFYADGAVKEIMSNYEVASPKTVKIQNFVLPVARQMKFHQTGAVKNISVRKQVMRRQDGTLKYYENNYYLELDPSGFVVDNELNIGPNLISLNAFSIEDLKSVIKTCGIGLADQVWSQAFPSSCSKAEKIELFTSSNSIAYGSNWQVENECKKDGHHMEFNDVEQGSIIGNVDSTQLMVKTTFPHLRYKMVTPEEAFDDLGNPIKGETVSEFLFIEFPKEYEPITKVFNYSTQKETKIRLDLNAYVECLKTGLKF